MLSVFPVLAFLLCLCSERSWADMGTTPHLKQIIVGRCYNYVTIVNPSSRLNCEGIWRDFQDAVLKEAPCSVYVENYNRLFRTAHQTLPCNKLLFWSKTRDIVHSFSAVTHHFMTLEDTLIGYMFNDLMWCGQRNQTGFDFNSCPEWSSCEHHPVASLWKKASEYFADSACGNITVILNGSINKAFNKESMFGSVEVNSLDPKKINYVNIMVIGNLEGPFRESCTSGSIVDLIKILQNRGFRWTCTDNDLSLVILQCVQDPSHPLCKLYGYSLLQKGKHVLKCDDINGISDCKLKLKG
ncbi:ADP-ribosyl cyclase/cyclic ADP-ribose hydrolase 1 [Amia ocellicauda]|uniref:ADP-ribosyl cyclase/cyclic ADP-ribose hydrolase 1 n=1 Tax=Amia ocellicauda TaxID=2972642 RepID=UPI003464679A